MPVKITKVSYDAKFTVPMFSYNYKCLLPHVDRDTNIMGRKVLIGIQMFRANIVIGRF